MDHDVTDTGHEDKHLSNNAGVDSKHHQQQQPGVWSTSPPSKGMEVPLHRAVGSTAIQAAKQQLRKSVKARLKALSDESLEEQCGCQQILRLFLWC